MSLLPAIELGANILGGLAGGIAGGNDKKKDRELEEKKLKQQRQLQMESTGIGREGQRRAQQLGEGQEADRLNRQKQTNPMRDQVLAALMARTGMSPGAFKPRDIFNPSTSAGTPQQGGIDLDALKQKMAGYQPGQGGVDPNNGMENQLLKNIGYTQGPEGQTNYQPIYDRPDIANPAQIPPRPKDAASGKVWDSRYGESYARQYGKTWQELHPEPAKDGRLGQMLQQRINESLLGQNRLGSRMGQMIQQRKGY